NNCFIACVSSPLSKTTKTLTFFAPLNFSEAINKLPAVAPGPSSGLSIREKCASMFTSFLPLSIMAAICNQCTKILSRHSYLLLGYFCKLPKTTAIMEAEDTQQSSSGPVEPLNVVYCPGGCFV